MYLPLHFRFKLAWELKYFYEADSPFSSVCVTDLFLLIIYIALLGYFFGTLIEAKFILDRVK